MLYTIGKFAKLLGVSTNTLRKWHEIGFLVPHIITPGGTRYYTKEQLNELLKGDINDRK